MRKRLARLANHRLATAALVSGGGAGALLLLRLVDPNQPGNLLPACPFFSITGLFCPGCGATRCLHALAHFDLSAALAMNPLLVVSLPALAILTAHGAGLLPAALLPLARQLCRPVAWGVLLASYGIARNLPWQPFSWLAPG